MIRTATILLLLFTGSIISRAQLCPGGGASFNTAIMYDPAWVYGCNTGSSCNGGINFDNRSSCEPTIAMDACAPNPSCGIIAQNASDIWFKFFPTFSNVIISCIQNTSMVIGIQAFQGSSCGALTEIGCAKAGGPSSGVQLPLNGLVPGQLYYFRIFGSSHTSPQRTGLYCFCGTQGLQANILPLSLESLKAITKAQKVELSFQKPFTDDEGVYEIEYSGDAVNFRSVYRMWAQDMNSQGNKIVYMHSPQHTSPAYYRLKRSEAYGQYHYSSIQKVVFQLQTLQVMHHGSKKEIAVQVSRETIITITDLSGRLLQSINLNSGLHHISTAMLSGGVYVLHNNHDKKAYKFLVR
jgi:hypothetical protein